MIRAKGVSGKCLGQVSCMSTVGGPKKKVKGKEENWEQVDLKLWLSPFRK